MVVVTLWWCILSRLNLLMLPRVVGPRTLFCLLLAYEIIRMLIFLVMHCVTAVVFPSDLLLGRVRMVTSSRGLSIGPAL